MDTQSAVLTNPAKNFNERLKIFSQCREMINSILFEEKTIFFVECSFYNIVEKFRRKTKKITLKCQNWKKIFSKQYIIS